MSKAVNLLVPIGDLGSILSGLLTILSETLMHSESLHVNRHVSNRSCECQLPTNRRRSSDRTKGSTEHQRSDDREPTLSGEDFVDDAPVNVRQSELAAAVPIREALMVEAEQMQDRRM